MLFRSVLRGCLRYWLDEIRQTEHFKELWKDGDDYLWAGGSYSHFFMPKELKEIVSNNNLKILECIGLEGLGSGNQKEINKLARHFPRAWKNWLEAHYALCSHPSVFATSGHMLIIGKKK